MRKVARRKRMVRKSGCGIRIVFLLIFLGILVSVAMLVRHFYMGTDMSDKINKTQYPIKYEHFVVDYSDKYGIDKYLVYAVMRTESKFDKMAVSSVGAKGLMQLTDETARDCAKKMGIKDFKTDSLFDPETNIHLGCYYLASLLGKYGDETNALAAYNCGPKNVDEWLKDKAYTNANGTLINIPYFETKSYVTRVKDARKMYKSIYESKN